MTPEDLASFITITDPQLHPDGRRIAFVVSQMNMDDDRYDRSIWLWDGESARQFTHGPIDHRPRWSSDGNSMAFLRSSTEKGKGAQVAVMAAAGGEAEIKTDFELGAREAEWSPDGRNLAIVATRWSDEWSEADEEERARRPRRITGPQWHADGAGFLHDRTTDIHLVAVDSGEATALTSNDWRTSGLVWRPDGTAVGFLSESPETPRIDSSNRAWEVAVEGGAPVPIVAPGMWTNLSYDVNGVAHVIGLENRRDYPASTHVFRVGSTGLTRLGTDLDRAVMAPDSGPQWLDTGACRVLVEDSGIIAIYEMSTDGSHHEHLGGLRNITAISCRADGSATALVTTAPGDPGELAWHESGTERAVTSLNEEFRATAGLIEPEHFIIDSKGVELDVWVYVPDGDGPFPVLFNIHGGPATQYGWSFFDEFQVELSAGYAVVATNPRGASGKGDAFLRGALGRWNEDVPPDIVDLMSAFNGALDRFEALDQDRMGIMGGSYGGLITVKILASDHRFKSAIPERGLYNFASFAGTSDIGMWFGELYVGDRSYDDWTSLWDASPLRNAHLITTPCLVIHSDSDHRCPIEQGEQLFTTLLHNSIEAEFLRFPGEGHELSRSGAPRHRVERFEAIIDWHDRYLGPT